MSFKIIIKRFLQTNILITVIIRGKINNGLLNLNIFTLMKQQVTQIIFATNKLNKVSNFKEKIFYKIATKLRSVKLTIGFKILIK